MTIEICPVDPFDPAAVDAWWDAYAAARRADLGEDATVWSREESRAELQQESARFSRRAYVAVEEGVVVGSASLALTLKDNRHVAAVGVNVPPQHRRRGIGSALLAALEDEAGRAGRTTMRADIFWPASLPADGTGAANREFARRHGYDVALGDLQNRLDLPIADEAIAALVAEAPAEGYRIRSWVGPVPEEFVAEWAALDASLDTEAPTGDLDIDAASADVQDFRADEALQAAQHRTSFGTIAIAPDGRVAGYTQLVVSEDDGNAYQWGTLVRREDRGHGIGLRIKLENLRALQQHSPQTPRVHTFNAESNAHMLAVNARLGFTLTARMAELQKRLG
ncbi:GNAT family N-acetyltransferase [Microbacterium sp.]|uniref:GNAT family N-acetyltransferase n=1 Tax=Microbacterium sp. TaxID=51671 RepID=UPI001AC53DF1|nr:GNAT family N-acetyltransferase [Microbacterium sp.]MBN9157932.1 GNAT family N-acetyltransferase [Microbacterium sp.]MBS1901578.1 GNAT family N-acetyltransferase [Actinomycetota bacterium]